jgi:hypothetical protein
VSEASFVETRRQHVRVKVIQSLHIGIITTRVEMIIVPNINIVRRGILIRSIAKLGIGSSGV